MNKFKRITAMFLAFSLLLPVNHVFADNEVKLTRIGGKNRYETAELVADRLGNNFEKVILASGENYPDALSGSILTESKYPILLVQKDNVSEKVKTMAKDSKEAVILGG